MVLIINQNLMKAKITTTHMKIIASVFTMCTNLARHSSQLLWQQYICFLQYPSLIIYTQGKKKNLGEMIPQELFLLTSCQ